MAISTVLFPTISRLAARDDIDGLRQTIASGMRQIFFMLLPASAFLLVLSEPVVQLVFQRGEFGAGQHRARPPARSSSSPSAWPSTAPACW